MRHLRVDWLLGVVLLTIVPVQAAEQNAVEEVLVTGSIASRQGDLGSLSAIDADAIERTRATHANEVMVRVPGVWITRGSGQEHLTAIRSPVFTGAGSCGEFLLLENGVPIRPAGFCNVNNLFEINGEQASRIEVLRGPASALFGGNSLYGTVNVVPQQAPGSTRLALEGGPHRFGKVSASASVGEADHWLRVDGHATHTDGYRVATGHKEQKLNVVHAARIGAFDVRTLVSGTNLEQQTGGFVLGFEAYDDSNLRRTNPNPEAYRDAWAARISSEWRRELDGDLELTLTPWLRKSRMKFLQHFLPGQPFEENGQTSAGGQVVLSGGDRVQWNIGAMAEWAEGDLYEFQQNPTVGSPFLRATRPVGVHYDYDVVSANAALFYDVRVPLSDAIDLLHSARAEWLDYDYDNNALDGNTRDNGVPCGFGGCLYTRPADRSDDFVDYAGRLGIEWRNSETIVSYALLSSGFRAPQATELYRLQSGQQIADLESETITGAEIGVRWFDRALSSSIATFVERGKDLVLRDANGFNISRGQIDSYGIEFEFVLTPSDAHRFELIGTYARHEYGFDRVLAQGETIEKGNDVDTAPRWLGSARWRWQPTEAVHSEIEYVYLGRHYVNAENTADYDGHGLWNWRGSYRISPRFEVFARVMNFTDESYADRADFAFGNYRYFPGTPAEVFAGFEIVL